MAVLLLTHCKHNVTIYVYHIMLLPILPKLQWDDPEPGWHENFTVFNQCA